MEVKLSISKKCLQLWISRSQFASWSWITNCSVMPYNYKVFNSCMQGLRVQDVIMFNVLTCQDFKTLQKDRFCFCTVNYTYRCVIFYAVMKIILMKSLVSNDGINTVKNKTVLQKQYTNQMFCIDKNTVYIGSCKLFTPLIQFFHIK